MMKAILSSGTSVLTRVTRRNILEDDLLHSLLPVFFHPHFRKAEKAAVS
jgi:hypothetical protein